MNEKVIKEAQENIEKEVKEMEKSIDAQNNSKSEDNQ